MLDLIPYIYPEQPFGRPFFIAQVLFGRLLPASLPPPTNLNFMNHLKYFGDNLARVIVKFLLVGWKGPKELTPMEVGSCIV